MTPEKLGDRVWKAEDAPVPWVLRLLVVGGISGQDPQEVWGALSSRGNLWCLTSESSCWVILPVISMQSLLKVSEWLHT